MWMKTVLQSKETQEAMDPLTGSQAHPPASHSLLVPQVSTKYAATSTPRYKAAQSGCKEWGAEGWWLWAMGSTGGGGGSSRIPAGHLEALGNGDTVEARGSV